MAIRRLSYRLDHEPDTGAVRLVPVGAGEPEVGAGEAGQEAPTDPDDLRATVERVMGADSELSYGLLPDGGRLLCARLPGQRVEALHLSADTPGQGTGWPIDTVDPELPAPITHLDRALLVDFARQHADRVVPFLADVRRLDQEAWRRLCEKYGARADDALRRTLRDPLHTWARALRLTLALTADTDGGPGLGEALDRLARALLRPDKRECAYAVQVLEEVDALEEADGRALTRRVLRRLGADLNEHKLNRLRELTLSPQGAWLWRHLDAAPLPVRLAASAARWSGPPDHLGGAELFRRLTALLPEEKVEDRTTLALLWHLVWRDGPPDPSEQSWIVRAVTPRLIIEADLGRRVTGWLRDPDRCDAELVAFARVLRDDGRAGAGDRRTAALLVAAQDLADGRAPLTRSSVDRLGELFRKAPPPGPALRRGIDERVGRALARAGPLDVCGSHGARILFAAGPELLRPYRAHFLQEDTGARLLRELPERPAALAAYFHIWRPRQRPGVSGEWRETAAELLDRVLAPVLAHVDDPHLRRVAAVLQREGQDVRGWTAWRHEVRHRGG